MEQSAQGGNNPNKGVNTRQFLTSIGVFLVVAVILIAGWLAYSAHSGKPNPEPKGLAGDGVTATDKGGTGR